MSDTRKQREPRGPFQIGQIHEGDRYELSRGHAIYCAPTGGSGARGTVAGAQVLDTDPAVESTGVDAGFDLGSNTLRAPDIAVGAVPDAPGWIRGVPPLAVEYAGSGQDEDELQDKIEELLERGTRHLWVVRLVGPRRVEVYEPGRPPRIAGPGETLVAPGVLQNPVPVEALYDRDTAHELTLRNLLQRRGFDSIEGIRDEGREEGREEGRLHAQRRAIREVLDARGLALSAADDARIESCKDAAALERWHRAAVTASSASQAFADG